MDHGELDETRMTVVGGVFWGSKKCARLAGATASRLAYTEYTQNPFSFPRSLFTVPNPDSHAALAFLCPERQQ